MNDVGSIPVAWPSNAEVGRAVGPRALVAGAGYARTGRARLLEVDTVHGHLVGSVRGSAGTPYRTVVTLGRTGWDVEGRCSCPVAFNCKHVAAVVLTARDSLPLDEPPDAWEPSISALVDGASGGEPSAAAEPLGLQVEVAEVHGGPGPGRSNGSRRVLLRPVRRGARGNWVRTGASWREVLYGNVAGSSAHQRALRALYAAYQSTRHGYHYSYAAEPAIALDDLPATVWPLLAQAVADVLLLVPATPSAGPVRLAATAEVVLDLRQPPDSPAILEPVVHADGRPMAAAVVELLGEPVHGLVAVEENNQALVLAPFANPPAPRVASLVRQRAALPIPVGDLPRFLDTYYPRLARLVTVTSTDGSVPLPELATLRLALTVSFGPEHDAVLDWGFAYQTTETTRHVPLGETTDASDGARDEPAERRLVEQFPAPELLDVRRLTGMAAVRFTEERLPELAVHDDLLLTVVGDPPPFRHVDLPPVVRLTASDSANPDWFDLGVSVSLDGEEIPFDQLFTALAAGEPHMLLPSGAYFSLQRPELDQLRRLIEEARALTDPDTDRLRLSVYQAGLWEELTELGVVAAQSRRWAETVQGLLDVDRLVPAPLPVGLSVELRPYQRDGYQWLTFLWQHGLGGILADDMGLGKTVQTLAAICHAQEASPEPQPFLVVAPTSVVGTWEHEARRFAPGLKVHAVTETVSRRGTPLAEDVAGANLVVTSYALFRLDFDDYQAVPWAGLVLDEAQAVKNHQARTYQCARRLSAPFKLAITGTPLENSLMDLWSLLSIVAPGLFPNPHHFAESYRKPIEREGDRNLLAALRRRIRPLMRRRTKEQVAAELPPKTEQVVDVELNPRHHKIYQTHLQRERQKVLGLLDDLDRNRFAIFRSLTLLRRLALDPSLVDDAYAGVRPSKVDVFLEQLRDVIDGGHRALVFSQFTGFLRTVRDRLDAEGVAYCYLDGRCRNRPARIAQFKDGDAPVFLISLKAGGAGLNLTEADYCFVLDPWWNPAVEAQAVDRAHRIGQDKPVMVYRLVAAGTIEEKVMELKARKQSLFSRVMDEDAILSAPLSANDIRALFG